jgi:hypothetical protein
MNKENAKDYLPFVQAMADGKTIQWKSDEGFWSDIDEIEFCMYDDPSCYRIKPEPRTWEIYVGPSGEIICGYNWDYTNKQRLERITVQEVLP